MKRFLLLVPFLLLSSNSVFAISPTPESSPSVKPTNASTEEIQKIRQAVQEKVKEKLMQISTPELDTTSPKSLMGTITQITDHQITISINKSSKTITVNEETIFIDNKRNKTQLEKIKVGQEILALGYYESENMFDAKRIVVVDIKSLENKNQVIVGKIVDISKSSPVFVLIPINNKNIQYQVKTDQNSVFIDKNSKTKELKNLASGQKIIVILRPDPEIPNTFYAVKIIDPANILNTSLTTTPTPKQ